MSLSFVLSFSSLSKVSAINDGEPIVVCVAVVSDTILCGTSVAARSASFVVAGGSV